VRREVLERSGLLAPGGLSGRAVRIALPADQDPRAVGKALTARFPEAGLEVRDRLDAAPGARRLIDQLEYFLGFIGLASLVAGGLGVAGAVGAYLATREPSIAVLKAWARTGPDPQPLPDPDRPAGGAGRRDRPGDRSGRAADPGPVGRLVPADPGPVRGLSAAPGQGRAVRPAGGGGLLADPAGPGPPHPALGPVPPRRWAARLPLSLETLGAVLAGAGLAALAVVTAPTPLAAAIMIAGVAVSFACSGRWAAPPPGARAGRDA
jgi:putative ABC transport system permease protein